jgi:thymidylate synthase ThyX
MIEVIAPEVEVYNLSKLYDTLNSLPIEEGTIKCGYPNERLSEYVGRICYNSQDKMTGDSYILFNSGAANKSHRSVFEFGNLQMCMTVTDKRDYNCLRNVLSDSNYIKYNILSGGSYKEDEVNVFNIYGSPRAFIELIELYVGGNIKSDYPIWLPVSLDGMLNALSRSFYGSWSTKKEIDSYLKFITPTIKAPASQFADITTQTAIKNDKYKKILFKIVSDRGCHNELVRHRPVGIMAESQRYVRYGIGDNAKNPFKICIASCHLTDEKYVNLVKQSAIQSFETYKELLSNQYPAQLARAALPIATAITYFMYADVEELGHICSLRTAKTALPLAQEVIKEVRDQAVNKLLI